MIKARKSSRGDEMENQLVVFDLANEHYGVDIAAVEGIIKIQPITAVPRAPSFVEGVTNLRGKVLPVIDLHKRFGLVGVEATKDTRIVVVEMNGTTVGIVVDAVSEVLRISPEAIEPPLAHCHHSRLGLHSRHCQDKRPVDHLARSGQGLVVSREDRIAHVANGGMT